MSILSSRTTRQAPEHGAARPGVATLPPAQLEVRCDALHPVPCDAELRGDDAEQLLRAACEHGAWAHGFTRAWYTPERVEAMRRRIAPEPD